MDVNEIFESFGFLTLEEYIKSLGANNLPVRLRIVLTNEFNNNFELFLRAVRAYEATNTNEAKSLLRHTPPKIAPLADRLQNNEIKVTRMFAVRNSGTRIDYDESIRRGGIVDENGNTPNYLFRYVSLAEYKNIEHTKLLLPSQFYKRTHASITPDQRYKESGGMLLAIKYNKNDQWVAKQASDEVYATTIRPISVSQLLVVE